MDILSLERENELIEKIAKMIVKKQMETPALVFLEMARPGAVYFSSLTILPLAPFLEFFNISGYDYSQLFMKRENLDRIKTRIEELVKEREK